MGYEICVRLSVQNAISAEEIQQIKDNILKVCEYGFPLGQFRKWSNFEKEFMELSKLLPDLFLVVHYRGEDINDLMYYLFNNGEKIEKNIFSWEQVQAGLPSLDPEVQQKKCTCTCEAAEDPTGDPEDCQCLCEECDARRIRIENACDQIIDQDIKRKHLFEITKFLCN